MLRNWILEQVTKQAEQGDFSEVELVLQLLRHPFDDNVEQLAHSSGRVRSVEGDRGHLETAFCGPVPTWAQDLTVPCPT